MFVSTSFLVSKITSRSHQSVDEIHIRKPWRSESSDLCLIIDDYVCKYLPQ